MKKLLFIIIPLSVFVTLSSCKIGELITKTGDKMQSEIDEIQAEVFPLDSASKRLVEGLLEGAVTEGSKANIDTLAKRISYGITEFLNERLKDLDTKSIGSNLMKGIQEEINDPAFQDSLNALVNHTFSDLRAEISLSIDGIFADISSDKNKGRLESLVAAILSDANSELAREFINSAISEISFSSLADSLRMNLLNEETRDALNDVIPTKIDSILNKTEGILDKLNENSEGFFERNIWTIVLAIASLMLLGTLLFFWRKKNKESKMNDVIMASINDMGSQAEYDALTKVIKRNAIHRGIESSLNERLSELGLLKE